jgi:hypothetical protein
MTTPFIASILMFSLFLLILSNPLAKAQNLCIDNQTLQFNISVKTSSTNDYVLTTQICSWGCDFSTNSCSPNPFNQDIYIIAGIFGFAILGIIIFLLLKRL